MENLVTPEETILQGAKAWNEWRKQNPAYVSFNRPSWYNSRDAQGVMIKGRNDLDFAGIDLSGISVHSAFAEGLNLREAIISNAEFEEGDFSRADFSGATITNSRFNKTIFTDANFEGAVIKNCNLNRVNLTNANFCVKEISQTVIYGISAWDLHTCEEMRQSELVIERSYELYSDIVAGGQIPMMVDNIELAQFIYYLSNHKKMRDTINILNDKGALLLGRFKEGGIERLYKTRDWLRAQQYMPMIFDFERPDGMNFTETVVTMSGLSKVIIADLSGGSVPHELKAILSNFRKKPVIAFSEKKSYSMLKDLKWENPYVMDFVYEGEADLTEKLHHHLEKAGEQHQQLIRDLADFYDH
jgi:hypothetical protein